MIGQGEMVNTSADDGDTMVDDEPTVLPEQGQQMRKHTPWPQPPVPAPRPHTRSLPHNHKLRKVILSVGWRFWGL